MYADACVMYFCLQGAINVYTKTNLRSLLLQNASPDGASEQRSIIIFHCEFSSKRGPSLWVQLRFWA